VTASKKQTKLTQHEVEDMMAIESAMKEQVHSVHPMKMEQFTEYLVRKLMNGHE
jgi:uncharacterized protein (UPF0305 family)